MRLSFPQRSRQRREGGQQDKIHPSSPTLVSAVPAADLSPVSRVSHPETGFLLLFLLQLLHAAAALPARRLPTPFPAFPVPFPAAGLSRLPGFGARGEHVSGLPAEPQDGAPRWGALHGTWRRVFFLPKLGLESPTGCSCAAAPGPHIRADGPRWRVPPLPEHGLQRGLPGGPSHFHSGLLRQVTPGDGEGTHTSAGVHGYASIPNPDPQISLYGPPLSLRQLSDTSSLSSPPVPFTETPQTQAEVQRQDRPDGSHHTVMTSSPQTDMRYRGSSKNTIAIF